MPAKSAGKSNILLYQINRTLQSIDLSGNSITHVGAAALAAVLANPTSSGPVLHTLSLHGNPLGDDGVIAVSEMLGVNKTLKHLDLGHTDTTDKGMLVLCSALSESHQLESLGIERLLDRGPKDNLIRHLARALACSRRLKKLGLGKFGLTDSEFRTLVAYGLTKNQSIKDLDLRGNKLSGISGQCVAAGLIIYKRVQ